MYHHEQGLQSFIVQCTYLFGPSDCCRNVIDDVNIKQACE